MSLEVGGMVSIYVKNKYSERRVLLRKAVICSFRRGISGFWQVVRTFVPGRWPFDEVEVCAAVTTIAVATVAVILGNCQNCIRGQQYQCNECRKHLELHHLVDPTYETPNEKSIEKITFGNML